MNKLPLWEGLGVAAIILSIGCCCRLVDGKPVIVIQQAPAKEAK